ncbi:YfiR family protein [Roseateles oligotrophus]|uniref:YfiR family protein n=1 Tax=Roseateles oligotrophus TaxID=1769250 RepID=A0ABT2YIU2_9BURK|nr:YfiR family protein [Roseateles oligotrophus]MCV2369986.1 YfiR family protein [Roseateles oligotrophus]
MTPETARAKYVAAFGSYVEWPANAFADATAPFVIGVMDDEPMLRLLESGFKTGRLQGRPVEVKRIDNILQAAHVHLLYTPEGNTAPLRPLGALPILTIGPGIGFLDRGGIIGLLLRDEQLRFELNTKAAERSGLKVSAKLQQLALRNYEEGH